MSHTRNPGYIAGDHWVECMRCGLEYRRSNMKTEWNGSIVCSPCWEPRHPQDFVRGTEDDQAAKGIVNPPTEENYTTDLPASQYTVPGSSFNHD